MRKLDIIERWKKKLEKKEDEEIVFASLAELFEFWLKEIPTEDIAKFRSLSEKDAQHISNMGLRNALGLWGFNQITRELMDAGFWHPDDMGCAVTKSFHRFLHDKPIDLAEQAQWFENWWENEYGEGLYLQMKRDRLQYLKKDGIDVSRWE